MNPLSAINAYVQPNGLITLLPRTGRSTAIPAAELQQLATTASPASAPETKPAGASFASLLGDMVQDVTTKQAVAKEAVTELLSGQKVPLHQAMIAMEEASVSFQLMVEVRNKLLESYQELMRMQV
jgi:flagellar hook-basal body complex protein FliE